MFSRTQRSILMAGAFLLVSCTDMSRFCRHGGNGYLQRWLQVRAAVDGERIAGNGWGIIGSIVKGDGLPAVEGKWGSIGTSPHIADNAIETMPVDAPLAMAAGKSAAGCNSPNVFPLDSSLVAYVSAVPFSVLPVRAAAATPAPEQDETPRSVTWRQLKDVVFNRIWDEKMDMPMLYPQFSRGIKSLNGAYIRIAGYVIPLDVNGGIYVLSANPNNACFFCGGAGPESVMALKLKPGHPRFKTDDYLSFIGKLRLNEKNIYELYYNLDGAAITN